MSETHKIADGQAVLFKRNRSSKWQVRIKTKNDGWYRTSTGEYDLSEAKEKAFDIVMELRFKAKNNIPQVSRKFKKVALLAVRQMQERLDTGIDSKVIYKDYIAAIENYHLPILGKYNIDKINAERIRELEAKSLAQYLKRNPKKSAISKSTLNTHNSALMYIFKYALGERWITESQIPPMPNAGKKAADIRPYFNDDEIVTVINEIQHWAENSEIKKGQATASRQLRQVRDCKNNCVNGILLT